LSPAEAEAAGAAAADGWADAWVGVPLATCAGNWGSTGGELRTRTVKRCRVDLLSMRGVWVSPKNSQTPPATWARTETRKEADPLRVDDGGREKSMIIGAGFMID
jgi:hypothetical protein